MSNEAYPLQWPEGWPRTEPNRRENPRFQTTLPGALANLERQLRLMGGKNLVLSSNYTLGASNPKDPGVVAYFEWTDKPYEHPQKFIAMSIPCDRWLRIEANVQAIALTIQAMCGMERWGAKHMIKAMFTGFKLLPAGNGEDWFSVLCVSRNATAAEIRASYLDLVKKHHPDTGGNHEQFVRVQKAFETARQNGLVS